MKKLVSDRGQVTILAALCMTVVLGFVGFAVDVGTLTHARREMQTAADAGAMAGAAEFAYGGVGAATTSAKAATALNGFTDGTSGVTVAVNSPPTYGSFAGQTNYVEVIVQQNQPTFFMKLFNPNQVNVGARAVAYNGATNTNCIYVLDPTADSAMDLQGSFDVSAPACGVIVNSNSPSALNFTGAGGTLTAGSIGVVGGDSGHTGDSNPAPVTGMAAVSNPLASVIPPDPTKLTCTAG
ncbi:MAG TPA: Tad domain-containing protein, partial [Acidobacteriaceae bacterium]